MTTNDSHPISRGFLRETNAFADASPVRIAAGQDHIYAINIDTFGEVYDAVCDADHLSLPESVV